MPFNHFQLLINCAHADARSAAEDGIFESLQQQIDLFFELAEYDWAPEEPTDEASDYLVQMLSYLSTMFGSLRHMPTAVARAAYFNTCKYIGSQLLGLVSAPEIKKVCCTQMLTFLGVTLSAFSRIRSI
eukprot:m.159933 g.159933  ORF g.159933 m.159933 type:complete len:129 (+) comp16492_c0_seq11:1746-2132(+)